MLNRKVVLALAAISTIAAAALAPTSASAMRSAFGSGGSGGMHSPGSGGMHVTSSSVGRASFGRTTFRRPTNGRVVACVAGTRCGGGNPPVPCVLTRCGPGGNPPIIGWPGHHHHWPPIYIGWHHPHWGVGVDVETTAVDAVETAAPAAPCNCLTKQYLPDGSVLFKDLCTKEAALATPAELKAQADGIAPIAQ
jgi:hypothetical protein